MTMKKKKNKKKSWILITEETFRSAVVSTKA